MASTRLRRDESVAPPAPKYPIDSVDKALRLLFLVRDRGAVAISEASQELGVAPSTVHRLFAMLSHYRLTERDPQLRSYRIGPALTELGLGALRELDIRRRARPAMEGLAEEVDETVHLAHLHGTQVAFLDCVECSQPLRAASRIGELLPAHCTASGKALLALLAEPQLAELLRRTGRLECPAQASTTSRAALLDELAAIRQRGWAENRGQSEPDLHAIAAAIVDSAGKPRGALTVAGPPHRMGKAETRHISQAVMRAAATVGAELA